ncbi:MAG: gamma-glutamylcyclotransferase [Pseudazoarcus pumilus]|nr:gamma-glutamylcyclotransferase [Pseudazoarcus pumilus]
MSPDIMRAACGMLPQAVPAVLDGFSRHPVAGEDYPGIRPAPGHQVAGLLYLDVPAAPLDRLDVFEGEQYVREEVLVTLADGRTLTAWTYVFKPEYGHLLQAGEWHFEAFLTTARQRFRSRYIGFQRG